MHSENWKAINPDHGPVWHGSWKAGHIEPNRRIYDFELVWFRTGNGRIITECGTWHCVPGSAVIVPPGLIHCTAADSPVERWCIHFDWYGECRAHREAPEMWLYADSPSPFRAELCAHTPPESIIPSFPWFRRTVSERFQTLVRHHFRLCPENAADGLERKGILLEILGEMLRPETEQTPELCRNRTFFRVKHRIDSACTDPALSIAALAEEARVTKNHLTRLFRRELGMSILDYIHLRRLEHAARLLADTPLTVREIAFSCGFNDPNYFIRLFRKRTGRTPGSRRRLKD